MNFDGNTKFAPDFTKQYSQCCLRNLKRYLLPLRKIVAFVWAARAAIIAGYVACCLRRAREKV